MSYDPLGRLYQVASGGSVRRSLFTTDDSGLPQVIAEYDGAGGLLANHAFGPGPDEPILWWDGSAGYLARTLHADERGSVIAAGDGAGGTAAINRYDEYGKPGAGNAGRFQYTGQPWLPELGLYHYRNRMYGAHLGRFLQPDPIGYEGGANLYAYVMNDPVNLTDPLGLRWAKKPVYVCTGPAEAPTCGWTSYDYWIPDDPGRITEGPGGPGRGRESPEERRKRLAKEDKERRDLNRFCAGLRTAAASDNLGLSLLGGLVGGVADAFRGGSSSGGPSGRYGGEPSSFDLKNFAKTFSRGSIISVGIITVIGMKTATSNHPQCDQW